MKPRTFPFIPAKKVVWAKSITTCKIINKMREEIIKQFVGTRVDVD